MTLWKKAFENIVRKGEKAVRLRKKAFCHPICSPFAQNVLYSCHRESISFEQN